MADEDHLDGANGKDTSQTIVLVDDEPGVLRFVALVLRGRGYRVLQAGGAAEALQLAQEHASPIHLLLTDVMMPGADGPALWESFSHVHPEARVLFMSGLVRDNWKFNSFFLRKPFAVHDLIEKVERVIGAGGADFGPQPGVSPLAGPV